MTSDSVCDPIADLEAILASRLAEKADAQIRASGTGFTAVAPPPSAMERRPEVVAGTPFDSMQSSQCSKGLDASHDHSPQYVIPASSTTLLTTSSSSPVHSIAGRRVGKSGGLSSSETRQPRRAAAKLEAVALKKTWDGRKSEGRKDKLTEIEKFSAAVWQIGSSNGVAVSLNLGIRREGVLLNHEAPKRRMMQNLYKHLSEAGLGKLPYALAFEVAPEAQGGRLHLHGAIDTSGLTDPDMQRLGTALRRAASFACGPIGGERQLDLGPLHNPAGWVDYALKDMARTKRELGVRTYCNDE